MKTLPALAAGLIAAASLAACKTNGVGDTLSSAGGAVGSAASGVPSLVNVDLRNVLNNLAVQLHLDRANVPINAQIPINLAVNVCGVSINVLSASKGAPASCSAQTAPAELAQVVQQQMAAGGNVGGGAQGGSNATNAGSTGSTGAGGAGTSGAQGTGGTSTGSQTTTPPPASTTPPTGTTPK
jgi:predicted small secreted protein